MDRETDFDASKYVAEDERHEEREIKMASTIVWVGLGLVATITVAQNAFIFTHVDLTDGAVGAFTSLWSSVHFGVGSELGSDDFCGTRGGRGYSRRGGGGNQPATTLRSPRHGD